LKIKEVISPFKKAFIKEMLILDRVVIANEAICFLKVKKIEKLLFKIDFHKAFDSIQN
jgi:hypothetical protein